ncbi:MAG TPA: FAD-binding oxidoreductase [Myxococcales bacterium]|nr:FAD-binding oxidoreductase [Myxococcales bacterium]
MKTSVAIVGGGVVGASIGWHLSKLGVRDVVIFERGAMQGEGSTGRATGGFRAQYGTDVNVRLSLLAREKLLRFREETGVDPGFEQRGYLWLAQDASEMAVLREALRVQRAAGLHEARLVDTAGIARLNPYITDGGGDFAGGAFCPTDGFIRPLEILRGYSRGLDVRYGEEVVAVDQEDGKVRALGLASGETVAATHFVDAAGAWAGEVGRLAGVEVPVAPLRRQVAATALTKALPAELPMTIWMGDGFHFRGRDGRVLLLKPNPGDPREPFSTALEADWIDEVVRLARARVPALAEVKIEPQRSWAGLYEMSPDKHALLGRAPGCENLWLANGSSGHGVMHAPALGLLLAEMIAGRRTSLDVRALRPERFAEGQPNVAPELL